jgi:hypothetical protein
MSLTTPFGLCRYAKRRYAKCRYAECRGTLKSNYKPNGLGAVRELNKMAKDINKNNQSKFQNKPEIFNNKAYFTHPIDIEGVK